MDDVVLYHPNTYNQAFVSEAGDLFEGDFVTVQFRPFEADSEGTALDDFQEWMDRQGDEPTELAMVGWINASLAFEGLLAAGPEFDREAVTAATNAMTAFDAGGLIEPVELDRGPHPVHAGDPRPGLGRGVHVVRAGGRRRVHDRGAARHALAVLEPDRPRLVGARVHRLRLIVPHALDP